ncbi:mediator of RNA polymerase II transcription subunit 19 isoform X1 [Drosophila serrata]|uniref:mediator of RNA polymerase II transcription subunit 19 isoform X1 n=1 Tax=Drosophila serrata TaxID=7274 RepID=UPI000A1D0842|nr:mediator of RNA polymerase II transcription subunit 19 isoform X1 [Drosophila serrata]KAH8357695.1 hypothetical protein KR200_011574 [Drosophila serrata]
MMSNYGNIMMDSPRSSPHGGGRSPVVARQDSSGTLKTTISLGKTPTIIHTGPFYSMKEPPAKAELTGDKDLMTENGLHHTLTKFKEKKFKESLASFLQNIPGINDLITHPVENSTLRSVIEKPPIGGKELIPLTPVQLAGFRLHPGPLPEQYRTTYVTPARKHKNKHKKHKHKDGVTTGQESTLLDSAGLETYEKKHKKQKRHEDDKERKKRKKEKKRKKKNQSPEPGVGLLPGGAGMGGGAAGVMGATNLASLGGGPGPGLSSLGASMGSGVVGGLNSFSSSMQMQQQQQQMPMQQQQQMSSGGLLGSVLGTSGGPGGGGGGGSGVGSGGSGMLMSQF